MCKLLVCFPAWKPWTGGNELAASWLTCAVPDILSALPAACHSFNNQCGAWAGISIFQSCQFQVPGPHHVNYLSVTKLCQTLRDPMDCSMPKKKAELRLNFWKYLWPFDSWVGKIPWRRERLPTPVFWPGEFHGLYSPWGQKVLGMTERLSLSLWPFEQTFLSGPKVVEASLTSCRIFWNLLTWKLSLASE